MKDDRTKQQKEKDEKLKFLREYQQGRKLHYDPDPEGEARLLRLAGLEEMVRLNQEMGLYD